MTHVSTLRFGALRYDEPSGAKSSEVRISYFDPLTGEPCESKPKPRPAKAQPTLTALDRDRIKEAERKEAADIMKAMAERKKSKSEPKSRKGVRVGGRAARPVLVDGVRYETIGAAANVLGVSVQYAHKSISNGKTIIRGRTVAFAEG